MTEKEVPEALRPYIFHGVELAGITGDEATGTCPFCGANEKFNINTETSLFKCWSGSCGVEGNSVTFLRDYWNLCKEQTTDDEYEELCDNSGFMGIEAPKKFGVVKSLLTDNWLVPGFNIERNMTGLYRFMKIKDKKGNWVWKLLPTPGMGHHLFNMHNYSPKKRIIDLCEGWRDGIAWLECLRSATDKGKSLITKRNLIAVPGTNSFKPQWCKFFAGCVVNILFDNDHPKMNRQTNTVMEGAGLKGVKHVASILMSYSVPPSEINFIAWGGNTEGYTDEMPNGLDLRDYLSNQIPVTSNIK